MINPKACKRSFEIYFNNLVIKKERKAANVAYRAKQTDTHCVPFSKIYAFRISRIEKTFSHNRCGIDPQRKEGKLGKKLHYKKRQ